MGKEASRLRPSLIRRSSSNLTKKQLKWYSSKISEDWKDGDTLNFKIDTFRNTVVYTIQGIGDKEVRTGVKLSNILSFTNNHSFPDFLQVFAYCGGGGGGGSGTSSKSSKLQKVPSFEGVKFTLKDITQSDNLLRSLSVDTNNGVGTIMPAVTPNSNSSSLENTTDDSKYAATTTPTTAYTIDTIDTMSPQSSGALSYDKEDEVEVAFYVS